MARVWEVGTCAHRHDMAFGVCKEGCKRKPFMTNPPMIIFIKLINVADFL